MSVKYSSTAFLQPWKRSVQLSQCLPLVVMQLLQDTLGSSGILCNGTMELGGTGFRPTRQDVFEFINQCGNLTSTEPDEVSNLKAHTRTRLDATSRFRSFCKRNVKRNHTIGHLLLFQLSHVESALRSHYRVRDSRDLGYGGLHRLADLVKRQRTLAGGGLSPVYYESALFAKHCKSRLAVRCLA